MGKDVYVEIRTKIGENFRKARTQKKLSLRQLEAITGVDYSWISKFEKGLVNFEIDTLIKLVSGLNIYLGDVCNFKHNFIDD